MPYRQIAIEQGVGWAQNFIMLILVGLGLTISHQEFIGGILFACAAASITARNRKSPVNIFWMIITAIVFAIITAWLWPFVPYNLPVQLGMGVSGFVSWVVPRILNKGMDRAEARTGDIVDGVIDKFVPDEDDAK